MPRSDRAKLAQLYRRRHPREARQLLLIFLAGHLTIIGVGATLGRRLIPAFLWRAPLVVALSVTYAVSVLVLIRRRRVRRFVNQHREGPWFTLCLACGHDLRGSLSGGQTTCPECGAKATPLQELATVAR